MKIVITPDAIADKPLIDGFAVATNWTDRSGKTKEEWLEQQVINFVLLKAKSGFTLNATTAAKATYVAAFNTALTNAGKVIIPPTTAAKP